MYRLDRGKQQTESLSFFYRWVHLTGNETLIASYSQELLRNAEVITCYLIRPILLRSELAGFIGLYNISFYQTR